MEGSAGKSPALIWVVNLSAILLVVLWTIPTFGIFVSSFRDRDAISTSGWWTALSASEQSLVARAGAPDDAVPVGSEWVISGSVFDEGMSGEVTAFGSRAQDPTSNEPGEPLVLRDDGVLQVAEDGTYTITYAEQPEGRRGARIFYTTEVAPEITLDNYRTVLGSEGVAQSFLNSLTVSIPATIIPILIAAFAAYALAWMEFPGRVMLVALIVGLLVVPLQLSLIPLLKFYGVVGEAFGVSAKGYVGIWLAHTGFGLPLAVYLLRNYMAGLPREVIESARVDGATDFGIFMRIVLPLSFPALASFAIFQFLWTWNDLLIAKVFLGQSDNQMVLTGRLVELLGSRGGDWEILTTSAFITIIVPLIVFFSMQKYLVRGLLAGSVKGG
ncbi:carbohydrate ABC transporter permease [Pontivivens nitratireducens]|uniref:Carbohydrate ABC transporter permease n=1 Tax=Pontivivens nitratireducens TaxID=2758038 RepID=A0A6G7VHD1_9RHOB|nr:carbohydrate ABC transporter permease [Pontibrevibacter nitratireducens]QIK39286.1 carbohydrate ABC transporter permease [Pontibrevibacter nitratireducens]